MGKTFMLATCSAVFSYGFIFSWLSGVGVNCRLYLSVVIVCCWLSRSDCRFSGLAVSGCGWFLIIGCWLLGVRSSCVFPLSVPTSALVRK